MLVHSQAYQRARTKSELSLLQIKQMSCKPAAPGITDVIFIL